jgi:hypothetical protein
MSKTKGQGNNRMKITRKQLRSIIRESLMEGYNSMSSASKAHAEAVKRKFMKLNPSAKVGIDTREGWVTVNGQKAINMSQASGSPLTDEEMMDKMQAIEDDDASPGGPVGDRLTGVPYDEMR